MSEDDTRLEELFEAAHRDPALKRELLANPAKVAEKWGVRLGDREIERLQKLGAFATLCQEVKLGRLFPICDPKVCYPSTVWLHREVIELVRDMRIFYPGPGPIFYPAWLVDRDLIHRKIGPIFYPPSPERWRRLWR